MAFLGKHFILMCHSKSATLPVHLFVSLFVNVQVLYLTSSTLNISQGFSLNRVTRTLKDAQLTSC